MKRRTFLKISAVSPFIFQSFFCSKDSARTLFTPATDKKFDLLEVKGNYNQIGYQIGHYFRNQINTIIERRSDWHANLLTVLNSDTGKSYSKELYRLTQKIFPHLVEEMKGIADGAGIHFNAFWAMTIKSELGALEPENPGCSTIVYNSENQKWLFHNEDGHTAYHDIMFTVKVHPPSGVSFVSMVYPGVLTGNGPSLNSAGIIQTTNYIGSTTPEIGLPRYVIGRAILEAKTLKEAEELAMMYPRAYPCHHNLASVTEKKFLSVETVPGTSESKSPKGIFFHTNHLLYKTTMLYQHEDQKYKTISSLSRYAVLAEQTQLLKDRSDLQPEDFLNILASHDRAPYSPCRHPEGEVDGQTLGTAFFDLNKGIFRLYKGNPCEAVSNDLYSELNTEITFA
jgi:predicted choloylglycine hydrolase